MTDPYVYRWDRQGRKSQLCAVTALDAQIIELNRVSRVIDKAVGRPA